MRTHFKFTREGRSVEIDSGTWLWMIRSGIGSVFGYYNSISPLEFLHIRDHGYEGDIFGESFIFEGEWADKLVIGIRECIFREVRINTEYRNNVSVSAGGVDGQTRSTDFQRMGVLSGGEGSRLPIPSLKAAKMFRLLELLSGSDMPIKVKRYET